MVLQGTAISQFIRTTYGSLRSEDLKVDLVGLFTSRVAPKKTPKKTVK